MEVAVEEIQELCKENVANYKVPKKYIIRDIPLPRTASGKIKKYELIGEIKKIG
jgi:acyl-coenzyme A synthetase/AMP-(fatty) acid ligase